MLSASYIILAMLMCHTVNAIAQEVARTVPTAPSPAHFAELSQAVHDQLMEHEERQRERVRRGHRSRRAVKRVCYGELGCFEDSGPFAYLEMLPSSPEEINTKFYFYSTRQRSDRPLMELSFLNMTNAFRGKRETEVSTSSPEGTSGRSSVASAPSSMSAVNATTFTTERPGGGQKKPTPSIDDLEGFDELSVRVIVHGFGSACPHVWIYEMKTALMAVEDCIVICVDWENGATFPNYVRAAANTRLVGKQLAMLLRNLQQHKGLDLMRTHVIGFSLGAHVSGFAGAELPGLSRITGLDPAGPLFEAQHPKVRLDSSDAEFVDVIHSNGENLILGGLGSWRPMGHVDYYPNGGRVQTGCSNLFVGAVTDFIWSAQAAEDEEGRSLCNHRRAYKFFIDSVAPRCLFPAFPCGNYDDFLKGRCFPCAQDDEDLAEGVPRCGNIGYYADRSTGRGQLYLLTREEEPFCAHQFQLQIFNSFNDLPLRTIGRLEAILEGDGGLNETFEISEKDDAEFFAGDIVSKIIVPHPALGFPTTLSLHYKSYSGWLSKGLPHWDIDKVVLTDSFGRSHSLCRPSTKLSSGSPVRLRLQAGNCELDNQEDYGAYTTQPPAAPPAQHAGNPTVAVPTDVPDSSVQESGLAASVDGVESAKQRKDIFNLGTSFKLARNQTYPLDQGDELPWQPILVGNSLDNETAEAAESSRSLSDSIVGEIFEPVLKDRRLAVNRGRNLQDYATTDSPEIMEPVLKATTPRVKQGKDLDLSESELAAGMVTTLGAITSAVAGSSRLPAKTMAQVGTGRSPDPDEPQTVQLLPFRLGELLQRAERYARETLLPLISVQAPRFFGFNVTPHDREPVRPGESRKPRYIPRYEESAFLNTSSNARRRSQKASRRSSAQQRNLLRLVRARSHGLDDGEDGSDEQREGEREQRNEVNYYTNVLQSESRSMRPEAPEYRPVFIDLPTYKPKTAAAFSTSAAVSAPLASAAVSGSVSLSRARRRGRSPKLIP
uniref:RH14406p n=1 Tax=Drosophila melanogaster TaxID=7227 RepID=Q5U1C3_DROME|nr:RH14406p [Drosophila melanogaster]